MGSRRTMPRTLVIALACVAVLAVWLPISQVASAGGIDLSGTWSWIDHAPTGDFSGVATIDQDVATGAFSWVWADGWHGNGNVSGSTFTLTGEQEGQSYVARWEGTVNAAGTSITGDFFQNDQQVGPFEADRLSGPSHPSPLPSPTSNADLCVKVAVVADNEAENDRCTNTRVGGDEVRWPDTKRFVFAVTNNGPDDSGRFRMTARLPEGLIKQVVDLGGAETDLPCARAAGVVTCESTVASGGTFGIQVVWEPTFARVERNLTTRIEVTGDSPTTNNRAALTSKQIPTGADLRTKIGDLRREGRKLVVPVTVSNDGPQTAKRVRLLIVFVTDDNAYSSKGTWSGGTCSHDVNLIHESCELGRIAKGDSVKVVLVLERLGGASLAVRTGLRSATPDPDENNHSRESHFSL